MDISFGSESLTEEIRNALQNNNQDQAVVKIQEYLDRVNNAPLNIAITGESGSGKSTFVNAFRGIKDSDNGAAPTGFVETTMEVTPYAHPNDPNVTLWDLPGIGTTNYPSDKYLKLVGFEKFDFFIIISDTRFRENDVKLAKEIKRMGKKFYFVRSKIDNDLRAATKSQRESSAEETLAKIKENCVKGLEQQGIESPQVFLVSSFELHLHEFPLIHETLEKDLPGHKRHALLMAMPNINLEIIEKKKKAFQAQMKFVATVSAAVAAVPVPGLSIAVDVALLVGTVTRYVVGFGLDVPSLQRLSKTTGVPLEALIGVIVSPLAATKITGELLLKLLGQSALIVISMVAEEACRFVPIIGIPAAMTFSFTTTYRGLEMFLNMLADDAQRVFKLVLGLKA